MKLHMEGTTGSENIIDENHTDTFQKIGEGDDGIVFKTMQTTTPIAIKVYVSRMLRKMRRKGGDSDVQSNNTESDFYTEISDDQANREIKALTLLKSHDNFMKLALDEIKKIKFRPSASHGESSNGELSDISSIQLIFVPDLYEVEYVTDFFGFKLGDYATHRDAPHLKIKNSMNFEHRNILFKHTMNQIYDATIFMHALDIQHRDLDICNVKMVYPTFQIKIMDFARANIPHVDRFPESENPYSILQTAKKNLKALQDDKFSQAQVKERNESLWKYCIKQYENPINDHEELRKVPHFKEFSDQMEIAYLLDRILTHHLSSFGWSKDSKHEETVIQENDLLSKYISHCHLLSLTEAKKLTAVDRERVSRIPVDDVAFVNSYINNKLIPHRQKTSQLRDQYLKHPRVVIHSTAWDSLYGTNLMTSPL